MALVRVSQWASNKGALISFDVHCHGSANGHKLADKLLKL